MPAKTHKPPRAAPMPSAIGLRNALQRAGVQSGRRTRQLYDIWAAEGLSGVSNRIRTAAARRIAPNSGIWPVSRADVMAAKIARPPTYRELKISHGQRININWVTTPPSPGSGGHTTLFRFIRYLEENGYRNRVYFYDVDRGDHIYYANIVRTYFDFNGEINNVHDGMMDAHAIIATSWPTAYPVYNSSAAGKRFYFVQDYEPYFTAVSSFSVMAENTYRMGFHAITAGSWLAQKLSSEFGMAAEYFDFGCDTHRYHLLAGEKRSGVAFYCRPGAPRRGFEIAMMAIEEFANRRPEIELHFYGTKVGKLPFPVTDHGQVGPDQLNVIYNRSLVGLSLSLTNVSLVPHEMLAAGCIPVVNDAQHNRMVLMNPFVRYVPIDPHEIAAELERVTDTPDFDAVSRAAAASARSHSWTDAGAKVDQILRRALGLV